MTLQTDLETAVALASVDSGTLNAVVHGPATGEDSLVPTDGGDVKTLARAIAEIGDTANQAIKDLSNVSDGDFATKAEAAGVAGTVTNLSTSGLATGGPITGSGTITVSIASQAEAEAGLATDKAMTPQRVAQAIAALASGEDQIARDMAVVALVEANAAGMAGTKGPLVLTNPFTSDNLDTKTNGTYDADSDRYDNRGALSSDLIPTMTGYTSPSGTVTSSSLQAGVAWRGFDDDTTGDNYVYLNGMPGAWVAYQFPTAQIVQAYTFFPQGTQYWPVGWHFQGSNDGTNWTTLHTVSGYASGWTTKQTFEFDNDTAYTHYRVYFNESTSGTYVWLMEIEMLARGVNQNATFAVAGGSGGLDTADPSDLSAYFLFEFPDADVTVGTDVTGELSIDGGTTQAAGAWTKIGDYGAGELWRLDADVSAQTGDTPHWEINTFNNKAVELHACGGILPIYAA